MNDASMKQFETAALATFEDALASNGFMLESKKTEQYFCEIVFVNSKRYVKISANTHPRDFPPYFNIILGKGSRKWPEFDWNSIALWRMKNLITSTNTGSTFSLEAPDKLPKLLDHAKAELLKFGAAFLSGDVTLFRQARSEQNSGREPYKIYSPDQNGKYVEKDEPESVKLKKKYS